MNRRKLNISSWYSLGLAAILVILCLVSAAGVTFARYRSEEQVNLRFNVRKPVSVCLGQMESVEDTVRFVPTNVGNWQLNQDGQLSLNFAVANGESEIQYEERNQEVNVRLISSLGVQNQEKTMSVKLTVPTEEPGEYEVFEAQAVRIVPGSAMHTTFGAGWVFRFLDKDGEELSWALEGGTLNWIEMELTIEGGTIVDMSLLQLQIGSRYIQEE